MLAKQFRNKGVILLEQLMSKQIPTINSREIANMVEMEHSDLIKKLEGTEKIIGIIPTLRKGNFTVSEYFIESSYKADGNNKTYKCYEFTKMGCEFIGNKFTGEKGILFTAKYVEKFNQMEQQNKSPKQITSLEDKKKLTDARYNNSLARKANILIKLADKANVGSTYKQILYSQASAIIAGKPLIPLPDIKEKTLTAEEIGEKLGISAKKVGMVAKKFNLKTDQYGKWFHDKSKYSPKEVPSFRYFENAVGVIEKALKEEKA